MTILIAFHETLEFVSQQKLH